MNCPNNRTIQELCNSPGVSCVYKPVIVQSDNCGNALALREVVQISSMQSIPAPNPDLSRIGLVPQCIRVRRNAST